MTPLPQRVRRHRQKATVAEHLPEELILGVESTVSLQMERPYQQERLPLPEPVDLHAVSRCQRFVGRDESVPADRVLPWIPAILAAGTCTMTLRLNPPPWLNIPAALQIAKSRLKIIVDI